MILTTEHIQQVVTNFFKDKPVNKVWLFGSYARGDADESSDVDILLDIDYSRNTGWDYFIWHEEISKKMKTKVELISYKWVNHRIKVFVDKDKRLIYEK